MHGIYQIDADSIHPNLYVHMEWMSKWYRVCVAAGDWENHCPSSKWKMRRFQNFNTISTVSMEFIKLGVETVYRLAAAVAHVAATLLHLFCSIWWLFWCLCLCLCVVCVCINITKNVLPNMINYWGYICICIYYNIFVRAIHIT